MTRHEQHRTRWFHNRRFVVSIGSEYPDWVVAALFYTALHAVETLFAIDGTRVLGGHTGRNQTLKRVERYRPIWFRYRPLYDAARIARYEVDPANEIPLEKAKTVVAGHLYAIEELVLVRLGERERPRPLW